MVCLIYSRISIYLQVLVQVKWKWGGGYCLFTCIYVLCVYIYLQLRVICLLPVHYLSIIDLSICPLGI